MAQKEPEKNIPSTAANAIMSLAKLAVVELHHFSAHFAFRWTHGTIVLFIYYYYFIVMGAHHRRWMTFRPPLSAVGEQFVKN